MSGLFEGLIGHFAGKSGRKAKRQNLAIRRHLAARNTIIKRRNFIRKARGAIAENMVAGGSRAGGLDSSGFQGAQASLATQREAELFRIKREDQLQVDLFHNEQKIASNEQFAARGAIVGGIIDTMISSETGG